MAITVNELKNAFREVVSEEFSNIPTDENSVDFTFSEKFERQMERLIRSQRKVFYSFVNTSYKRVATVLVVLLTTAVTLFSIKPVRDGTFNFLGGISNSQNQSSFEDNPSSPDNVSSNHGSVTPNSPSSNTSSNQAEVIYRLVYALKNKDDAQNHGTPSKNENLVNGYLKSVVSQFEGQDNVYFRVIALPIPVKEEFPPEGLTPEEHNNIIKQRMEYIKGIGAIDIVKNDNSTYYLTVKAEMINKIGEAGGCYLYLATISNPDKYPDAVDNIITIEVTEGMEIP